MKSFNQVLRELRSVISSLYALAPFAVIVGVLIITGLVAVALQAGPLMVGFVLLIVLAVAILVYTTTQNYGEAALALAAGLLSIYSVEWSTGKFVGFVGAWVGFSAVAFLISSIRVASRIESIYIHAAIALADPSDSEVIARTEKALRQIADHHPTRSLGPVEKAEVLRLFAFRRIPMSVMTDGLSAVEILSVVTNTEPLTVAKFVADVARAFEGTRVEDLQGSLHLLTTTIRDCAVPPTDFFRGFESSRHLILSRQMPPAVFFYEVKRALEAGIISERVGDYLEGRFKNPSV